MSKLFGLAAGSARVSATFWLLQASDSLLVQSHRNVDGTGIGVFDTRGEPTLFKQSSAAFHDANFAYEAQTLESATFVAHVRHSSGTPDTVQNTHPFVMGDLIGAHHGVIEDVGVLEKHLGEDMKWVHGDTDSERILALVRRQVDRTQDVTLGLTSAMLWLADHVVIGSLNLVLTSKDEMWAVRYPDTHALHYLDRRRSDGRLSHHSRSGMRVESDDLAARPSVVVASEPMDDSPGWKEIQPGQVVHVTRELYISVGNMLMGAPRRRLDSNRYLT